MGVACPLSIMPLIEHLQPPSKALNALQQTTMQGKNKQTDHTLLETEQEQSNNQEVGDHGKAPPPPPPLPQMKKVHVEEAINKW